MKKPFLFFLLIIICTLSVFSQTWTEPALIAGGRIEYTVITKDQYDRLLGQHVEDGSMCKIAYNDAFYVNDNKPVSGTRPAFNGYYYLSGILTTAVGRSRVLAYGNSNTGRLEMAFAWFHNIEVGSDEFATLYYQYIRRINGE